MILHPHVTGVVLAGGLARRMGGADKASLRLGPPGSRTTLSAILDVFAGRFHSCVVVGAAGWELPDEATGAREEPKVRVTTDRFAGCGPLGGIHAALGALTTPHAFVCGCDMPLLSGPLLDFMARRARKGRLLVPVRRGRPEPLHAIYPACCLAPAERALKDGVRMMREFFERVSVDWLEEREFEGIEGAQRSFCNINAPEDLESLR